MGKNYQPREVEAKWQRFWEANGFFQTHEDPSKPKFYLLEMFPYPSGDIHMGHVRNYSIGDALARFLQRQGYNVLHPIGWDAFGLPAENAAIKHNAHPKDWTYRCIERMRGQLKRLGYSYDWRREFATCDPSYYRWEQWLFARMYENDLAYRKKSWVNWCPSCATVLANEQVSQGRCWRCNSEVTIRELEQWFFRITNYAEELLAWCDKLTGWPPEVITMQKNWIGRSEGAMIAFPIEGTDDAISIFTTRPDTLFGVTFMSLAPENPLARELSRGKPEEEGVRKFIERELRLSERERTAVEREKEGVFTGAYCRSPLTDERIPIFVANFVLMEYGTGAIMAVPAHDQRDFEFAKKHGLPIKVVINPPGATLDPATMEGAYEEAGTMVNSAEFSGMDSERGKWAVVEKLEGSGLGEKTVSYRLRDWGISRQRYWGAPIPVIYCDECGVVPVPDDELPVVLPRDVELTGTGGSPLEKVSDFVNTTCPRCNGKAKRETDTFDTFVESSWYFLRYTCPDFDGGMVEKGKVEYWMPVDLYIGGIEHAVMHLLYARFYTKVMRDLGLVEQDEPFVNLLTQGMVIKDGAKMAKSKGNVVNPDDIVEKYGADTARLFMLSGSPPQKELEWSDQGVEGAFRFLQRVWRFVQTYKGRIGEPQKSYGPPSEQRWEGLYRKAHQTIKKATADIRERYNFNTAIAALHELANEIAKAGAQGELDEDGKSVVRFALETLVSLLNPFAPHITEELWRDLGMEAPLPKTPWPEFDPEWAAEAQLEIAIQINGKLRSRIWVEPETPKEEIERLALEDARVQKHVQGKPLRRVIHVPNKLINFIV